MLNFDENRIIAHLKNGEIIEESFPTREALSEALRIWAMQGHSDFTGSHGTLSSQQNG